MLVEMAIGDAYGAAFEFVSDEHIRLENDLTRYKLNPEISLGGGRYTDDTQMSIALAEHILSGEPTNRYNLMSRFLEVFKRDPRRGYSKRLYQLLLEAASVDDFCQRMQPLSTRSGAAMRASPAGLLSDLYDVKALAEFQASLTHDTMEGRISATAIAVMVHYLAYALGPREELGRFLDVQVAGYAWSEPWQGRVDMLGTSCAHAAIYLVSSLGSQQQVLRNAVALGGDVDTVAAIAMFSASLCPAVLRDLPAELYDGLENETYGRSFLEGLDRRLMAFAGIN